MFSNVLIRTLLVAIAIDPLFAAEPAQAPIPSSEGSHQFTVILDPGHGGNDAGAVVKKHREKDIALAVAIRLRKSLKQLGGTRVLLTRDSDVYVPLDQRVAFGSDLGSAVFLSIHVNASDNKKDRGIVVYSFGHATNAPKAPHRPVPALSPPPDEESLASAIMASSIAHSLRAQGLPVQGVVHSDYYVLKNPRHPSILIEIGYLSNRKDYNNLTSGAYRQKLAEALARSLNTYIARQYRRDKAVSVASR